MLAIKIKIKKGVGSYPRVPVSSHPVLLRQFFLPSIKIAMMLTLMMVLMMMIEYVDCNDDDIDNVNIHDDCNNGYLESVNQSRLVYKSTPGIIFVILKKALDIAHPYLEVLMIQADTFIFPNRLRDTIPSVVGFRLAHLGLGGMKGEVKADEDIGVGVQILTGGV